MSKICSQCGKSLSPSALRDLCPECSMNTGIETLPPPTLRLNAPASSQFHAMPEPGYLFGRYRIISALGQGGMGSVYEAEEEDTGRRVALKVLGERLNSAEDRARFLREGRLAASINHPNCVYVYGTEEIEGQPVISMELVTGGTLQDRVKKNGPMPVAAAVDAILQIIDGLEAAEKTGILHRDIKPANCFEDSDGTVKIGDFGLSIAKAGRGDTQLTVTGQILGTPAYCSPEQLRGEELNARSDMYAVGVSLYYLLTGRIPFEGQNMAQIIAIALEKPPPSPTQFRSEIPRGLAKVVLRCLKKQSTERFKTYDELRRGLASYSSAAPTPATLWLRGLAGWLDQNIAGLAVIGMAALSFDFGDNDVLGPILYYLAFSAYFAVLEGVWGASLGKAICGLRVVGPHNSPPGVPRALARALMFLLIPSVPILILAWLNHSTQLKHSTVRQAVLGSANYLLLAALFSTIRRRNGFAAVHELATGTRVVTRVTLENRPVLPTAESAPPPGEAARAIGPYQILETLEHSPQGEWLVGYDLRLLRKAWIRVCPPGTPPVAPALRNLGRPGRLRWLAGKRGEMENWDAFEGLSGKPLLSVIKDKTPWGLVRFWLFDLARELQAAEKDGTTPLLALERVWITGEGRAKLLDFPPPGLTLPVAQEASSVAGNTTEAPQRFLAQVAKAALEGSLVPNEKPSPSLVESGEFRAPIPLHARVFLKSLSQWPSPETIIQELRPLLGLQSAVSRRRRAGLTAACTAIPLAVFGGIVLVTFVVLSLYKTNPGLMEFRSLMDKRHAAHLLGHSPAKQFPDDRQLSIYIASHYRDLATNDDSWIGPIAVQLVKGADRKFLERSLAEHPTLASNEIAQAEAAIKPILPERPDSMTLEQAVKKAVSISLAASISLMCVAVPAWLAALAFRGGLFMRIGGVAIVGADGAEASRWRCLWRALIAWSPVVVSLIFVKYPLVFLIVPAAAVASLILPGRSLQDRLAGTWLVPR